MSEPVYLGLLSLLSLLPILFVARFVGAGNTSFMACIMATLGAVAADYSSNIIAQDLYAPVAAVIASSVLFCMVLRANVVQGFVIAISTYVVRLILVIAMTSYGVAAS